MKVALLSFHNAYNYGAALQAYGLQKAVEKLGAECEYIDYVNPFRKAAYHMPSQFAGAICHKRYRQAVRIMAGTPFMAQRKHAFRRFYDSYLKTTDKTYHNSQEAAELNDIYDKFIVGSDQVWNYEHNGTDWAYLLDFVVDDQKKISYSSSFGLSTIPTEYKTFYKKYLTRFERLAVREEIGIKLVKSLTGRDAHLVLDPVFLAGTEIWDSIRKNAPCTTRDNYIFFYTNDKQQIQNFLHTGYPMEGLTSHILSSHVTLSDFVSPTVKVRIAMSPESFLNEIAGAKLVVTASFHCTAFAIMFHKPVCVILSGNRGKDERLRNLLRITGLESRILKLDMTAQEINEAIDYNKVDNALKPYYEKSWEYLRHAVLDLPDVDYENEIKVNEAEERFCVDERCTGCSACRFACPVKAIQMEPDNEGFLRPNVDESLCIHCGCCHSACQVFTEKKNPDFQQRYFAFKNIEAIRKNSSSGGMFTALSDQVLRKNGIIVAASMDESFHVHHKIAEDQKSRDQMRKTFYVQSDLGDCFPRIRRALESGRVVLFVGTPCQVQGLKLFLGKDWENLLTVDLVCHGAPSPMVFEKFINFIQEKGKLEQFLFRDKALGWKGYHVSAVIDGKKVKDKLWLQSFNNLFSHNLINRKSCGDCPFTNYERVGDLTIGDFWGIKDAFPTFYDNLGVSLVICNTKRGTAVIKEIEGAELIDINKDQTHQGSLCKASRYTSSRHEAFHCLATEGYLKLAKKYGEWNMKGFFKDAIRRFVL